MTKFSKLATSTILIIVLTIFIVMPTALAAKQSEPRDWDKLAENGQLKPDATVADAAVIMDSRTGKILYQENATEKRFPASITKIMTCLVVLENAQLTDIVTVPNAPITEPNARLIGLEPDERLSVEDLLYALMVYSANDAGVALAVHLAGGVADFSVMMNNRAAEIGMTDTHFVNPHGLHHDNHYTTAMDMAKLTKVAMENEEFRKIVSTYMYDPPVTNKHNPDDNAWPEEWIGTNDLISDREDKVAFNDKNGHAIGIKTGYTKAAGGTLVAAAESYDGSQEVITVTLNSSEKFVDSITMFLYAFEFYDTLDLTKMLATDKTISAHVENAKSEEYANIELMVRPQKSAYITDVPTAIENIKSAPERFKLVQNINGSLTAPIKKDQVIGTVDFFLDDGTTPIMTCDLVAQNAVEAMPDATPEPVVTPVPQGGTAGDNNDLIKYIGYGLVGLVVVIIIIAIISSAGRKSSRGRHSGSSRGRSSQRYGGSQRGRGRRR